MLEKEIGGKIKTIGSNLLDRLSKADCLVTLERSKFNRSERIEIDIIYKRLLNEKGIELKEDSTEIRLKQKETYLEAIENYSSSKNSVSVC